MSDNYNSNTRGSSSRDEESMDNNYNRNGRNTITPADIPWSLKARYIGTGYALGVLTSPMVRKVFAGIQPKLDQLLDNLTGQVENLSERSSDFLAKAKDAIRTETREKTKSSGSSCSDSCESETKSAPTHNA